MLRSAIAAALAASVLVPAGAASAAGYTQLTPSMIALHGIPARPKPPKPVAELTPGVPVVKTRKSQDVAALRARREERVINDEGVGVEPEAEPRREARTSDDRGSDDLAPADLEAPSDRQDPDLQPAAADPAQDPGQAAVPASDSLRLDDALALEDPLDPTNGLVDAELAEAGLADPVAELTPEEAQALRQRKALSMREAQRQAVTQAARN